MFKRAYEKLVVWQEAHRLCLSIYETIKEYPSDERFCLVQQMRRAGYSIPMNIAEGNSKRTSKNKLAFVEHAEGSLDELDYQCVLSRDLQYISPEKCEDLRNHIKKVGYLIHQFRKGIKSDQDSEE